MFELTGEMNSHLRTSNELQPNYRLMFDKRGYVFKQTVIIVLINSSVCVIYPL